VRLYPDAPAARFAALLRDVAALLMLLLLVGLGVAVHDAVDRLAVLGEGVSSAGGAVQGGFESAADSVDGTPLVGDDIGDALREAGEGTGGNVQDAGERGESAAHDLADILGLLFFGLPAALVFALWLPKRVDQVRMLNAAARALDGAAGAEDPERTRLIAMRAAFSIPYADLVRYTPDPLGDLAAGRYDALLAAAYDEVGLRPPRLTAER
jgi:hypothetical protein